MTAHSSDIQTLQNDFSTLKTGLSNGSGSTYVRWGRKSCPSVNETELGGIRRRFMVHRQWRSFKLYLARPPPPPPDPQWDHYSDVHDAGATVYGTEYQLGDVGIGTQNEAQFISKNLFEEDVHCSVCRLSRPTTIMIPGRTHCYTGWTTEYSAWL